MMNMMARTRVSRNVIVPMRVSFEWWPWLSRSLIEGGRSFCLGINARRGSEQDWGGGLSGI